MADNSLPKVAERSLPDAAMANVTHVRVVSTDNSEKLPIANLTLAGTKVTVAVDGLSGTVDGAFEDVLTQIAGKADTIQVEALDAEKVDKTQSVLAGAGMTGGGTFAGDVTLNVATADDSLVVAADNVKVNTYNGLDSTSATRPLSAAQGKALDGAKVGLTGNETVAGIKTFSSSPIVPTPTTDMQASTKKYGDDIVAALNLDINNVTGAVSHYKRVLADAGGVFDRTWLLKAYNEYIKQRPETLRLYIPELGAKLRTSGQNRYGVKAYDMSANAKDAVQLTDATQPYMTVGAAPNARLGMRFVQGQTQTGLMDFDDVVFAAGASWTLTKRVKINSKGTGRVYLGAAWIETTATTVVLNSGTVAVLTGTYNFEAGRTYTIEFQYSNGVGLIMVGVGNTMIPIATTPLSGAVTFGQISYSTTYPADRAIYAFHLTNTRKSAYQSAFDHTLLSTLFPDIESVTIGNQVWSTDNFCGTVAGDGTVVNEVQGNTTDGNTERIDTIDFTLTAKYTATAAVTSKGLGTFTTNAAGGIQRSGVLQAVGKASRCIVTFTSDVAWQIVNSGSGSDIFDSGAAGTFTRTFYATYRVAGNLYFRLTGAGTITFTSISDKDIGASDSTNLYNYVYDATTGTAAVKDLAATKAASMWCHYVNLAANGAVYGKLYNWYAVHLFDLYPPVKGWRVPSSLDFNQLIAVNGGGTVAGGKLKAKFGGFDNANASNESGFSLIASGRRNTSGVFQYVGVVSQHFTADARGVYMADSTVTTSIGLEDKIYCFSLRLLRNEPAGQNELSYTSGLFTTDITSVAKQIPISFGRTVDYIRIKSENSLTAIEAKLHNAAGTAVATLITGKTIGAGETKMFAVTADWVSLLQDGSVRVTAAGNSGAAVGMEIEVLTHKGVLS